LPLALFLEPQFQLVNWYRARLDPQCVNCGGLTHPDFRDQEAGCPGYNCNPNLDDYRGLGRGLEDLFHRPYVIGGPSQAYVDLVVNLFPYAVAIIFYADDVVVVARDQSRLRLNKHAISEMMTRLAVERQFE
jgi:hypothetical protein